MGFREWLRSLIDQEVYKSQKEMAKAFGTKQPTIAHYLRGTRLPDLERSARISQATGIPLADIVKMVRAARNTDNGEYA